MSSTTFNESEDFVPELLTPSRSYMRSLSLLNLSFRRKKSQDDAGGLGSPKRRPRTPPTMMPLREEQHEDRSPMCNSGERDAGEAGEDPAEAAVPGLPRSFLPWIGGGRRADRPGSQGDPFGSREAPTELVDEADATRATAGGGSARTGRPGSREDRKETSAWPSFLRRAKSKDNSAQRRSAREKPSASGDVPAPPASARPSPLPAAGDLPLSDRGVTGDPEVSPADSPLVEDGEGSETRKAPAYPGDHDGDDQPTRSAGLGFPFLRAPWKRGDVLRGTSPAKTAQGALADGRRGEGERSANGAVTSGSPRCPEDDLDPDAASSDEGDGSRPQANAREANGTPRTDGGPITSTASGQTEAASSVAAETSEPVDPAAEDTTAEDEGEEKEVDEDHLPDDEKAALQWERYRARNRSLIVDVFEGQLRSQLTCCKCGTSSSTFEPFRYLSVPIPSNHIDRASLRVVFFPLPFSLSKGEERQQLMRYSITVPRSSTVSRVEKALSSRLPVPMSSVLLAEVYRSRIHRYLDPNLPLSDVRAEDQLFAFETLQTAQDLVRYQERHAPTRQRREPRTEEVKASPQARVLLIQAMHRRVVDVCRSDGRTWAQRREVFGLPFVMSAASSWTYATLHDMLMLHARRFLKQPRREPPRQRPASGSPAASGDAEGAPEERQVPFVARIVNASGTACGACDRRNCTGCLLPKGSARLRLRAGMLTGSVNTAKIYLALDWVDSAVYDQEYVDNVSDDLSVARANATGVAGWQDRDSASPDGQATAAPAESTAQGSGTVPISACIDAFAQPEEMKVEFGNGVKCETCNEQVDAVKKLEVWREPDVLILHIKRFHFSGEHFEKLNTPVEVPPRELNLKPWIVGPSGPHTAPYELYGAACHSGGMSGGHYTSYCVNEDGKEPKWLKFNDEAVTSVSLKQELDEISKQCYVLFYRKRAFSSSNLINYSSLL